MKVLTLTLIKAHTRISGDIEDTLLELYADAAEDTVFSYIDRTIEEVYEEWGEIPKALVQAMLLLVDNSYTNRSLASPTNMYMIPYSFDALVKPYMKLS